VRSYAAKLAEKQQGMAEMSVEFSAGDVEFSVKE
jgi:hypothetical protein